MRSDEEMLKDFAQAVEDKLLPDYRSGELGWMQLIKTAFWLGDLEQRVFFKNHPLKRWHDLPKVLGNPHPAILHALDIRDREGTKGQNERDRFASELEDYAAQLLERLQL